jgi:hypothetical protein
VSEPPKLFEELPAPGLISRFRLFLPELSWSNAFFGFPGITFEQMSIQMTFARNQAADFFLPLFFFWPIVARAFLSP